MAGQRRPAITSTVVSALSKPTQTTLSALLSEFEWSNRNVLEALAELGSVLEQWNIECTPPIGELNLEDARVLRTLDKSDPVGLTSADISRGEGATLEFKESLVLDVKKHLQGGQPLQSCFSEKIVHSSLKTIAGYLNGEGGVLLIGVTDNGVVAGIDREFALIPGQKKGDFDEWELFLRAQVEKNFYNGRSIGASIQVTPVPQSELTVGRIVVGKRRELCVMKGEEKDLLYIRAGNRTLSVEMREIEQYFSLKKLYL